MIEKKVLEAKLRLEKMSKEQELQKKEEEITEQKRELELVRKDLETGKQKLPATPQVYIYLLMKICHHTHDASIRYKPFLVPELP